MIIVIQCAASKRANAGHLKSSDGRDITFVANPASARSGAGSIYAKPDDIAADGQTWRSILQAYNNAGTNPLGLSSAYQLYENRTYELLTDRFGVENLFILSAGWGLVSANYLLPTYDITFSQSADAFKRRRKSDQYKDFSMLPASSSPITFFGGKDYVPLFCALTKNAGGPRTVFYNSDKPPIAEGCSLERYPTRTRANWHYECARRFADTLN